MNLITGRNQRMCVNIPADQADLPAGICMLLHAGHMSCRCGVKALIYSVQGQRSLPFTESMPPDEADRVLCISRTQLRPLIRLAYHSYTVAQTILLRRREGCANLHLCVHGVIHLGAHVHACARTLTHASTHRNMCTPTCTRTHTPLSDNCRWQHITDLCSGRTSQFHFLSVPSSL